MLSLLEVKGLKAYYGQTQALYDVGFDIADGGITTLLGANGAGKTTTLRAICNMVRNEGTVDFDGENLVRQWRWGLEIGFVGKDLERRGWGLRMGPLEICIGQRRVPRPTEEIVRKRIAHVPEGRGTFTSLTVDENLRIAAYTNKDKGVVAAERDRVLSYFPRLRERVHQQAGTLSGGEQQMLAIARALMLKPRLMLLDEPSFGLAPLIVVEIFRILRRINEEEKVSILLVEQNAALALDLATQAYVLETGRVVMSGPSAVVKSDENVRKSYLGY
jgi:branched-chain amino acid transport system ATP-binding protein